MLPITGVTKYEDKPLSPKERAKDLVAKFQFPFEMEGHKLQAVDKYFAKQCALICVEEILSAKHDCGCEQSIVIEGKYETYVTYWDNVKKEIQSI